ncbi:CFC_collapsed_G0053630.mRNA.1.CDS.1 [Saccharomyces cerevisiae]|nr:CFC_collapsed_G0053630.mRNA.1.CDS.1 [Saccharomyces cerevisiae]
MASNHSHNCGKQHFYRPESLANKFLVKWIRILDVVFGTASDPESTEPLGPSANGRFLQNTERELTSVVNEEVESDIRKRNQLTAADEINYICCNSTLLKIF